MSPERSVLALFSLTPSHFSHVRSLCLHYLSNDFVLSMIVWWYGNHAVMLCSQRARTVLTWPSCWTRVVVWVSTISAGYVHVYRVLIFVLIHLQPPVLPWWAEVTQGRLMMHCLHWLWIGNHKDERWRKMTVVHQQVIFFNRQWKLCINYYQVRGHLR
jgi:hypothetical protein